MVLLPSIMCAAVTRKQQLQRPTYLTSCDKTTDSSKVHIGRRARGPRSSEAEDAIEVPAHAKKLKDRQSLTEGVRLLAPRGAYLDDIGGGWYSDPPAPLPPPPQYTESTLVAPYGLHATLGSNAVADAATGKISDFNWILAGSNQDLASVGSLFVAGPSIRRIRVEATINMAFAATAAATFGYSSAEVLLNLKVLDGTQVVGSNRLSLVRQWGVVFWVTSQVGEGTFTLACEFAHSYGTPRTYAAIGELETWTGGGGLVIVSGSTAIGIGTNAQIRIRLIE